MSLQLFPTGKKNRTLSLEREDLARSFDFNRRLQKATAYNREDAPSPQFRFTNAALAASGIGVLDFYEDNKATRKYGVFTNLLVVNNSGSDLLIYVNQDRNRVLIVPTGTTIEFDKTSLGGGITSIAYVNNGSSSISASTASFVIYKEGVTPTSALQNIHRKIFGVSDGIN